MLYIAYETELFWSLFSMCD